MFELNTSDCGLLYRARRGQPQAPLIVMLHGLSGDETVMWLFEQALPPAATIVSPRALYASPVGGYSWARAAVPRDLDSADFSAACEALRCFIAEVIPLYEIDPRRVVVMGFSQGAAVSYALSLTDPARVCGAVALAGFLPEMALAEWATPRHGYLILHGVDDDDVPIARARQARTVLAARGAAITYYEYPVGHKVSAQGMRDLQTWLTRVVSA